MHFLSRNLEMREKGVLPSISRMRVPACSASGSLGATGGSMAMRRCSYTAASCTFYQEILRCEKRGVLPLISHMRVPVCSASGSLGATGGSMAMRRCNYTAAFKLKLVEYAERHPCAIPREWRVAVWRMCTLNRVTIQIRV